jgi:hypothetical protein
MAGEKLILQTGKSSRFVFFVSHATSFVRSLMATNSQKIDLIHAQGLNAEQLESS